MSKKMSRRFFLVSASGSSFSVLPSLSSSLIGGSLLGVAYACPSGEPPLDTTSTRTINTDRPRTHSTRQFVGLSDAQIRELVKQLERYAAARKQFRIQGYTNSASLEILKAAAAYKQRKLIQKWIRRLARMRNLTAMQRFLDAEAAKLRKLRLAEEARLKKFSEESEDLLNGFESSEDLRWGFLHRIEVDHSTYFLDEFDSFRTLSP